jgi:hypothetical protein
MNIRSLSSVVLVAAMGGATAMMTGGQAPEMRVGSQAPAETTGSVALPGFHVASASEFKGSAPPVRLHARPRPLTEPEINTQLHRMNPHLGTIHLGVSAPPQITYQLENYTQNTGSEVNTNDVSSAIFYGAPGYVQVNFTVNPGTQYLLDCSLGQDGNFSVGTTFITANPAPYAGGTVSSFGGHLMIPFNPTPNGATSAQVVISFTTIEFDGCQVDTVGH